MSQSTKGTRAHAAPLNQYERDTGASCASESCRADSSARSSRPRRAGRHSPTDGRRSSCAQEERVKRENSCRSSLLAARTLLALLPTRISPGRAASKGDREDRAARRIRAARGDASSRDREVGPEGSNAAHWASGRKPFQLGLPTGPTAPTAKRCQRCFLLIVERATLQCALICQVL